MMGHETWSGGSGGGTDGDRRGEEAQRTKVKVCGHLGGVEIRACWSRGKKTLSTWDRAKVGSTETRERYNPN